MSHSFISQLFLLYGLLSSMRYKWTNEFLTQEIVEVAFLSLFYCISRIFFVRSKNKTRKKKFSDRNVILKGISDIKLNTFAS